MVHVKRIKAEIQLLVEGNDQRNFFEAFLTRLSIGNAEIWDFGGVYELQSFLLGFVKMPGFDAMVRGIGIVRDAEKSSTGAFHSVQQSLLNVDLPVPDRPEEPTTVSPRVSVLILPGRNRSGMLESLLCESFSDTPENRCIDDFMTCVDTYSSFEGNRRPEKARARVYLTTKPEPHLSVGVAAKKGYWDFDHDVFTDIRRFLKDITNVDSPVIAN